MKIGLALSGGGARAAVFHLGVLRRLAIEGLLEQVEQLSTVSGGSLGIAAMMGTTGMRWPASGAFEQSVYPSLRELLTTTDLFTWGAVGWLGLLRFNVRLLRHRAAVLADLLERQWKVAGLLSDLPDRPTWWINTTCLETGKNWRFSKREMGDWQFGRHYAPPFRLADAAAASAAVPYIIGALGLPLPSDGWYVTDPATRKPLRRIETTGLVHLWDGGAYENLGLEPLYKLQKGLVDCDFLLCSDASGPLTNVANSNPLALLGGHLSAPRLFDIASDQIRSLRSRMLMASILSGQVEGALVRMGNSVRDIDIKAGRERDATDYAQFQKDEEAALAFKYPTDLKALSTVCFDRIARHGFEVADATLNAHAPKHFPTAFAWP
jgi:NTE family protein